MHVNNFIPTQIITQPISQTICGSELTRFVVSAIGENLSYNWNNSTSNPIMTTSIIGNYLVTVSGVCSKEISQTASLTIGNCSNTSILEYTSNTEFYVYPNPANFGFSIETNAIGKKLIILNLLGNILHERILNHKETFISLPISKGVYIINIENEYKKLIIE